MRSPKSARSAERREIWWLHPATYLVVLALIVVAAFAQSEQGYAVEFNSNKWIDVRYMILSGATLLFIALGLYFGMQGKASRTRWKLNEARLESAYFVITAICFLAYLVWFANFVRLHGVGALLSAFSPSEVSSNMYVFRENSGSISGVTTFTEFGVVSSVLAAIVLNSDKARHRCAVAVSLTALLVASLLRASLFSERLAFIELALPFAVAWFGSSRKSVRALDRWLPLIAVVGLVAVFAVFEYQRSWLTRYVNVYDSFWDFAITRLLGYYTNAANTEAMYVTMGETSWLPYWSVQWLWQMPGMEELYGAIADPNVGALYSKLLATYANPEFNNPGGLLTFFKDFSYLGFALAFFFGYLAGGAYAGFRRGELRGLLFYPCVVLALLEMPRYFYFGVNRGFLVFVALAVIPLIVGRSRADGCASVARP